MQLIRSNNKNWRQFIDLEHDECYSKKNHWNALTDGRFKYIYDAYTENEQLFDLVNDPGEINDLAKDLKHKQTLKDWRGRLIEHLAERGKPFVADGKLLPRRTPMLYSPLFPSVSLL